MHVLHLYPCSTTYNTHNTACLQVRHMVQKQQGTAVLMAYGISAAGKTYTIEGTRSEPGLLPRALELLFRVRWLCVGQV